MTTKQAKAIVKTIKAGNDQASVALLKTFGLVKLTRWRMPKVRRPNYYWLKPEVLK